MRLLVFALWTLPIIGCSALHRLERNGTTASLSHKVPQRTQSVVQNDTIPMDSTRMRSVLLTPEANGELLMRYDIERVVVRARARTLPEREGAVSIDFSVSLPRALMGSARRITVTPLLHRATGVEPLEDLVVRGALFAQLDKRREWLRSLEQHTYSETPETPASITRWDSMVKRPAPIEVHYAQRIATAGEGKRLSVLLSGSVEALDGSIYRLHSADTLQFILSSVLSFVDTTTRYVTRVVEKYATAEHRTLLTFHSGASTIAEDLGNNRNELSQIDSLLTVQLADDTFLLDSLTLSASASPEGFAAQNLALTRERADAFKARLIHRFGVHLDTLVAIRPLGEDWAELERLIGSDTRFEAVKTSMSAVVRQIRDPDRREAELRRCFPSHYTLMRTDLYPQLRAVRVRLSLRRAGMVKDTIHTTEVDTVYAHGRRLLEERHYADALDVLEPYQDQNTALALMSLGQDRAALSVLLRVPPSASIYYLRAVLWARLNAFENAQQSFEMACELNPSLRFRARLDPELSSFKELIR